MRRPLCCAVLRCAVLRPCSSPWKSARGRGRCGLLAAFSTIAAPCLCWAALHCAGGLVFWAALRPPLCPAAAQPLLTPSSEGPPRCSFGRNARRCWRVCGAGRSLHSWLWRGGAAAAAVAGMPRQRGAQGLHLHSSNSSGAALAVWRQGRRRAQLAAARPLSRAAASLWRPRQRQERGTRRCGRGAAGAELGRSMGRRVAPRWWAKGCASIGPTTTSGAWALL